MLNSAKISGTRQFVTFSDSQLVTSQMNGDYQARNERMATYLAHAKQFPPQFEKVEVKQIGRDSNSHADALAKLLNLAIIYLTATER